MQSSVLSMFFFRTGHLAPRALQTNPCGPHLVFLHVDLFFRAT